MHCGNVIGSFYIEMRSFIAALCVSEVHFTSSFETNEAWLGKEHSATYDKGNKGARKPEQRLIR